MKKVIIVGSSRNDGDTANLTKDLLEKSKWDVLNLNDYQFSYFDYKHENRNDDYLDLIRKILDTYETLIFITPVYWYSMSGIMKVFFDRFTDLLTIEKELGRKLKGKKMAAVSCSTGENLGEYLGMEYLGNVHTISGKEHELEITKLIELIEK